MRKKLRGNLCFSIISFCLLLLYVLCILVPMGWGAINSLKAELDYSFNPVGLPQTDLGGWQFSNYYVAWKLFYVTIETDAGGLRNVEFFELLFNSLVYGISSTFISLFSHIIMSYVCCKYKCGYTEFIYKMVIVVISIPVIGNLASEIQVSKALGVYDNLFGICIMKGGFFTMYFLIFFATFSGVPDAYREAATIDGAGHWSVLLKIILPMVMPTVFAVGMLQFISYWNEYYTAMVYLPSSPTIGYALYLFERNPIKYNTIPVRLAASFFVAMPLMVIAIVFRKKIIDRKSVV